MSLLEARGIEKGFGGNPVLRGIDFSVRAGEIVGLLGENGAGKSTLMNILSGNLQPDRGTIAIAGREASLGSAAAGQALGIRFIHQELSLLPSLTVAENISVGRLPRGRLGLVDRGRMRRNARAALDTIGAMGIDPKRLAGSLRLGEQQLVEIARAVSHQPRLLIMDEPTSSLTAHEVDGFFAFVRRLAAQGTAIIFITHRLEEALSLCHRLVVLRNGALVADRPAEGTDRQTLIADMTGRASLFTYQPHADAPGERLLEVEAAGDGSDLAGIDLDLRSGEVVGLFGLVGAGRTELLELIFGARRLRTGRIEIGGRPARFASPADAVRRGLALVPEGRKVQGILPQHDIARNVAIANLGAFGRFGFVSSRRERAAADRYRQALGIRMTGPRQAITALSGGNQQKVLIGRALATGPRLLLLDEPTHGVDIGAKSDIYEIIRAEARSGRGILVASSETEEILTLCDRVAVMSKGRLVDMLDRGSMSEARMVELAFTGH
ncbi:sugar ABC transporter ATP-binding protein [Mangrovicella endophytica]|uniref:sugar ABC transporter ATP-binding protein n=1 Tax=Mangrovicella endophytica TaxID=2066697 RepID=UPI001FDFEF08|nr:sugar ABC transporter ATP-binding protein [Mangrovicella endophytica]